MAKSDRIVNVKVNPEHDTTALEARLTKLRADAEASIAKLQAVVRTAHEALGDINAGLKRAMEVRKEFLDNEEIRSQLRTLSATEYARFAVEMDEAIRTGTQAAYDRFDGIIAICLGLDSPDTKSLEELLRTFIRTKGLPYGLFPTDNDDLPEAFRKKGVRILADDTMPEGEGYLVKKGKHGPEVVEISSLLDFGAPGSLFGAMGIVKVAVPDDSEEGDVKP